MEPTNTAILVTGILAFAPIFGIVYYVIADRVRNGKPKKDVYIKYDYKGY